MTGLAAAAIAATGLTATVVTTARLGRCRTAAHAAETASAIALVVVVVVETMTVVTTVKAVAHSHVTVSWRAGTWSPVATVIPGASAIVMPGVAAAIDGIEPRITVVEIVTVRIAGVDTKVPVTSVPVERTVEIACRTEGTILPVEQDITEVQVTVCPVGTVKVVIVIDTQQIVEVDLESCLILILGKIQLVGHLVGEEQSLTACLLVAHCIG